MKRRRFFLSLGAALTSSRIVLADAVKRTFNVTLREAHKGTLEIDTRLLDSYSKPPGNVREFYFDVREIMSSDTKASFSDAAVLDAARRHGVDLMGGPMLGGLRSDGATIWLRPAVKEGLSINVNNKTIPVTVDHPGEAIRVDLTGLSPNTAYRYSVAIESNRVAEGRFTTAPEKGKPDSLRIAFGSCFHKIGVHNPNLFNTILARDPHVMLLLGDLAVDDRENRINMHRADYQLRDVSNAWRRLSANLPLYASWDDHDYLNNDLSGVPRRFKNGDRDALRAVWRENWNNPTNDEDRKGIYFNTRIGPVEVIMLDTRSCRDNARRNQYGAYLGETQQKWLLKTLQESTAPFKIISSGTMWSDYVSKAKDSWGSWDKEAREELFQFIEDQNIGGVLLVSGDRHGARGFQIPRPSGFNFYEFEPACLGGASGPGGLVKNCPEQLFGYSGRDDNGNEFVAFGEFTFDNIKSNPSITFRLISQLGKVLQEHRLMLDELTPRAGQS